MTQDEIKTAWPIATLFDELITYVDGQPQETNSSLSKQQIKDFILAGKSIATTTATPRYDIFQGLMIYVKSGWIDSIICKHNATLCDYWVNRVEILTAFNFKRGD